MTEDRAVRWVHAAIVAEALSQIGLPEIQCIFLARDGRVRSRADAIILNYGQDGEHRVDGGDVAVELWRDYLAGIAREAWRSVAEWQSADFGFQQLNGVNTKLIGVKFCADDLLESAPGLSSTSLKGDGSQVQAKARTPEPKWNWEQVLIDLVAFAHGEGLHDMELGKRRGGQAKLEKWLAERWGESGPSETEIRKRAAAVLTAIDLAAMNEAQKTKKTQ